MNKSLIFIWVLVLSQLVFAKNDWNVDKSEFENVQRDFYYYIPKAVDSSKPYSLMLLLHGCSQTAQEFIQGTQAEKYAIEFNWVMVAPEQPASQNYARCWNWFDPDNQKKVSGEPGALLKILNQVLEKLSYTPQSILVSGLSAGASMASILASCSPEIFKGALIHSGLQYKGAESITSAIMAMNFGSSKRPEESAQLAFECSMKSQPSKVMVVHGDRDSVVHPKNGDHLVSQFLYLNDLYDDGELNGSVSVDPSSEVPGQVSRGYDYKTFDYTHNGENIVRFLNIKSMGHAWSGGQSGAYMDAKGPQVFPLFYKFISGL